MIRWSIMFLHVVIVTNHCRDFIILYLYILISVKNIYSCMNSCNVHRVLLKYCGQMILYYMYSRSRIFIHIWYVLTPMIAFSSVMVTCFALSTAVATCCWCSCDKNGRICAMMALSLLAISVWKQTEYKIEHTSSVAHFSIANKSFNA